MRTPIVAGNWKMHKTGAEARELASAVAAAVRDADGVEVVICPPFTALSAAYEGLSGSRVSLGAQDVHWEREGAFTGEVSAPMLRAAGCRYVIIGHSERRYGLGETDEHVARKVRAAAVAGLRPIICVGETLDERRRGDVEGKIRLQVRAATALVTADAVAEAVFAYEPIWAIGTGESADGATAQAVCRLIRDELRRLFGDDVAERVRIQYGGSVKPDNIREFAAQPDIDGALVGGASLQAATFAGVVTGWKRGGTDGR